MTFTTNYLEPYFVGLFEARGGLYSRRRNVTKTPFLRIMLPPTKENQAMLELLDKHLKLGGFIGYTKPSKANPSKVFWQSTKVSIPKLLVLFETYPTLTGKTKDPLVHFKLQPATWQRKPALNQPFTYPKYFGPWLSGFLESESRFICSELKLEFKQQINSDFLNVIKNYFQSQPNDRKGDLEKNSNRFCLVQKQELNHMIEHFDKNPMLGDGRLVYERFKKTFKCAIFPSFANNDVNSHYLEPFFVGLFEGDGCIYTIKIPNKSNLSPLNKVKPVLTIELKALPKNVFMLNLIKNYIGGTMYGYKKTNKRSDGTTFYVDTIRWTIKSKKGVAICRDLFKAYPPLTSNKIGQLKLLNQSDELQTPHNQPTYKNNHNQTYGDDFKIPHYFGPWLSGFIEAEGSFISKKRPVFSISQNNDWYILNAIKTYYSSAHRISKSKLGQNLSYKIQISNSTCLEKIVQHIERCPLLGHKQEAYKQFRDLLYSNNTWLEVKADKK